MGVRSLGLLLAVMIATATVSPAHGIHRGYDAPIASYRFMVSLRLAETPDSQSLRRHAHPAGHRPDRITLSRRDGGPFSLGAVTVRRGKIVELDILADADRLRQLDLAILED